MIMTNIVADGRQRVLHGFLAVVTICDAQVMQSLLQQVRVSTNALSSRLSLSALQQFICNKGLDLLHSFNCEPKRWVLVSNPAAAETSCMFQLSHICYSFVHCSLARVSAYTFHVSTGNSGAVRRKHRTVLAVPGRRCRICVL